MGKADVNKLPTQRSLIDLSSHSKNTFNSVFVGYDLCEVLDDIILAEFSDDGGSSNTIIRNGIVVPVNAETNAWRIGKVIIHGDNCKLVKKGDYICFPNNLGVPISNIEVTGYGTVRYGIFLNEQRIFGTVKPRNTDACIDNKSKTNTTKRGV
jgi:hypothetical protein